MLEHGTIPVACFRDSARFLVLKESHLKMLNITDAAGSCSSSAVAEEELYVQVYN